MSYGNVFRVFLSSTFKDMYAERDYLREHAFRRLNAELNQRGYSLKVMDLRGSTEEENEQAERNVFRMCLTRLNECRPRMIGLIGERYGWVYYSNETENSNNTEAIKIKRIARDIAADNGIAIDDIRGRSITQLEIEQGLKSMDREKCFFYVREELNQSKLAPVDKARYISEPEKQRQIVEALKQEYKNNPSNIKTYPVNYLGENIPFAGLEKLDQMVYEDLKRDIEKEIAEHPETENPLMTYIANIAANSINSGYDDELINNALNMHSGGGIIVEGVSGWGKTTLLARVAAALMEQDILVLPHFASFNTEAAKVDNMLRSYIDMLSKYADGLEKLPNYAGYNRLAERFQTLVNIAAKKTRVVIIIDAVEAMEDEVAKSFSWFDVLPENARLIATALPNSVECNKPSIKTLTLPQGIKDKEKIGELITCLAEQHSKKLEKSIFDKAVNKVCQAGGLALYAVILVNYLMTMTGADYEKFTGDDAHIKWMADQVNAMPLNVHQAFESILYRAKGAYDEALVSNAVALMSLTRPGIRTSDLTAALMIVGVKVNDIELLELRDYLSKYLRRGQDIDQWQIDHKSLREHIISSLSEEKQKQYHRAIVAALKPLDKYDEFRKSEYLYHCFSALLTEEVVDFFSGSDFKYQVRVRSEIETLYDIIRTQDGFDWLKEVFSQMERPHAPYGIFEVLLRETAMHKYVLSPEQAQGLLSSIIKTLQQRCVCKMPVANDYEHGLLSWAELQLGGYFMDKRTFATSNIDKRIAENHIKNARERIEKLHVKHPDHAMVSEVWMIANTQWSKLQQLLGNKPDGGVMQSVKDEAERRAEQDGSIGTHNLGVAALNLAQQALKNKDIQKAKAECAVAEEKLKKSMEQQKSTISMIEQHYENDMFNCYFLKALIIKTEGNAQATFDAFKQALDFIFEYYKKDMSNRTYRTMVARAALAMAEVLMAARQLDAAADFFEMANSMYDKDWPQLADNDLLNEYVRILTGLGALKASQQNYDESAGLYLEAEQLLNIWKNPNVKNEFSLAYHSIFMSLEGLFQKLSNNVQSTIYGQKKRAVESLLPPGLINNKG